MSAQGLAIRRAREEDLPAIVALIADDALAQSRDKAEGVVLASHRAAFAAIEADPNQFLAVATLGADIVGCFQLSFIPGLSKNGAWRGQIETVRVAERVRGRGIGGQMMEWAFTVMRERGCPVAQLATDKSRRDAHRFYERLGFLATHKGMKRAL